MYVFVMHAAFNEIKIQNANNGKARLLEES